MPSKKYCIVKDIAEPKHHEGATGSKVLIPAGTVIEMEEVEEADKLVASCHHHGQWCKCAEVILAKFAAGLKE